MRAFKRGRGVRVRALQLSLFALSLVTVFTGTTAAADPPRAQKQPEKSGELRPRITVSKTTTHILQPLDSNGNVDYLAALNQMTSQGVTRENNAAVPLFRAFGPGDVNPPLRSQFFKLLQIEPLPEQGEYLTDFNQFINKKLGWQEMGKRRAELDQATSQPWSKSELPLVAEWLANNQKALQLIVEGTQRPKCYFPLVARAQESLFEAPLPPMRGCRYAARLLAVRAMQRLRDGKIDQAEQDLLACHRLGRLVGRMPITSLVQALAGIAIDGVAFQGDAALMEYAHLSAPDAIAYQSKLRNLPPLPVMADAIDVPERFQFLDGVSLLARDRETVLNFVGSLSGFADSPLASKIVHEFRARTANWDEILRMGNEELDKMVAAARQPTFPERRRDFEALVRELRAAESEAKVSGEPGALTRRLGKLLALFAARPCELCSEAETRARTRDTLDQLGFALVAYRAEHPAFPEKLDALAPKYIPHVSNDLYTEQPLRYTRNGQGFVLDSFGANGKHKPSDDLTVRIPHK
jgi:hypothetical protein